MKIKLAILPLVLLAGCATSNVTPSNPYKNDEPILVGKSVQQRIAENSQAILNQLELLNRTRNGIATQTHVGNYSAVTHNNNLDARVGSANTVPKELSKKRAEIFTKKIENIEWKNQSLNTLGQNFAAVLGYDFATQPGKIADKDINFSVKNMSVEDALNKLGSENSQDVNILVVDEVKMLTFIYKK